MIKHLYNSGAKPAIAALALTVGIGLSWATLTAEDVPILITIVLWGIVSVLVLILLGALISTSVEVDDAGVFSMSKTLGGLPMVKIRLQPNEIKVIELNRTMTPGLSRGTDTLSNSPDKPRYRLEVVHENGKCLVDASANYGSISSGANRLAAALNRPLHKTGDWTS